MNNIDEVLEMIRLASREPKLLELFMKDLLTPRELREIATRWQIVKRLAQNENQRVVAGDLKIGIATVTRGSRMLANLSGGFNLLLEKIARR